MLSMQCRRYNRGVLLLSFPPMGAQQASREWSREKFAINSFNTNHQVSSIFRSWPHNLYCSACWTNICLPNMEAACRRGTRDSQLLRAKVQRWRHFFHAAPPFAQVRHLKTTLPLSLHAVCYIKDRLYGTTMWETSLFAQKLSKMCSEKWGTELV